MARTDPQREQGPGLLVLAILVVAVVSSAVSVPAQQTPDAKVPAFQRAEPLGAVVVSRPGSPTVLSLESCVQEALLANDQLIAERLRRAELDGKMKQALSTGLPTVDFVGDWSRGRDPSFALDSTFGGGGGGFGSVPGADPWFNDWLSGFGSLIPAPEDIQPQSFWHANANLNWTIKPQQIVGAVGAAKLGINQQTLNIEAVAQDTADRTLAAYFTIIKAAERIRAVEAELANQSELLGIMKMRYELGMATRLDTLQAAVTRANIVPRLSIARADLRNQGSRLNALMGRRPEEPLSIANDQAVEAAMVRDEVALRLAQQRPDLAASTMTVDILQKSRQAQIADNRPYLTLFGSYGYVGNQFDNVFDTGHDSWRASVAVNVPVFDGLNTRGKVAETDARIRRTEAEVIGRREPVDAAAGQGQLPGCAGVGIQSGRGPQQRHRCAVRGPGPDVLTETRHGLQPLAAVDGDTRTDRGGHQMMNLSSHRERIRWACLPVLTLVLIAGGCRDARPPAETTETPRNVRVMELVAETMHEYFEVSGPVAPVRGTDLSAQESGPVVAIAVTKGATVHTGEIIVEQDRGILKAEMDAATAALAAQSYNVDKVRQLHEAGKVSRIELLTAESAFAQAQALADVAGERYRRAGIRAPFDGVVADRFVELGQLVAPGMPVVRVIDPYTLKLEAYLTDDQVRWVAVGEAATVVVGDVGRPAEGHVSWVGFEADRLTGKFKVEIELPNPDLRLRSGVIGRARLGKNVSQSVVTIPRDAVLPGRTGPTAFVVQGDRAVRKQLTLGAAQGLMVQVADGVTVGDRLVVRGHRDLRDGSLVRITEIAERADGTTSSDPDIVTGTEIAPRVPIAAGNSSAGGDGSPEAHR